jgi:hypothetical protein
LCLGRITQLTHVSHFISVAQNLHCSAQVHFPSLLNSLLTPPTHSSVAHASHTHPLCLLYASTPHVPASSLTHGPGLPVPPPCTLGLGRFSARWALRRQDLLFPRSSPRIARTERETVAADSVGASSNDLPGSVARRMRTPPPPSFRI